MLHGVSGALLASRFLERVADEALVASDGRCAASHRIQRWWRRAEPTLGPASGVRKLADTGMLPLLDSLGYKVVSLEPHAESLTGVVSRDGRTSLVICVAPWNSDAERAWRDAVRATRVVASRWAVVFTGSKLRVVDAERTWSRRALEFDLAALLTDERGAALLAAVLDAATQEHGARSLAALTARSDAHGVEVCAALGSGVHDALNAVFGELGSRPRLRVNPHATFEQALTVVYRLLFLLFAEARALVPVWHHVYRDSYTIESLCRRTLVDRARPGLWKAVQAISRLAHQGCRAGDLIVTPFNGRLFSPAHTPLAERGQVSDAAIARALVALSTTSLTGKRERIAYSDLGVEQLGAVYERVLEYQPDLQSPEPMLTRTSLERKSTGSFYTPRSITDFLVRRALHPLVAEKTSEQILRLRVLDPAMGSGAFLVAACRFLSAAAGRAFVEEGSIAANDWPHERQRLRRLIAERCLFGVDLNPMAVQLARLSLWLASLSADRPLTFLDHHLVVGDSLIGASFADLARDPFAAASRSARPLPLLDVDPSVTFAEAILPERFRLTFDSSDTPTDVQRKEQTLLQLNSPGAALTRWKEAANLWCAAWFWSGTPARGTLSGSLTRGVYRDVLAALIDGGGQLRDRQRHAVLDEVSTLANAHRFFHWPLEFPEVFCSADGRPSPDGGFDAVLGNPPWEMLRADAGDDDTRLRVREGHRAARRFFRDADIYRFQSDGHTNRYQLFVERCLQLTRPCGRIALILPGGLASDQGCARLRHALFEQTKVERLIGFDNREAVFPIHRDMRFFLLTATKGGPTTNVMCRMGQSSAQWLDTLPDNATEDPPESRPVTLATHVIRTWDPAHMALPWITHPEDVAILSTVANSTPRLSAPEGWNVRFGRELNATDDRRHFVAVNARTELLPIVEGKHLQPFQVSTGSCTLAVPLSRAATLLDKESTFGRDRLAYREVASATNRLTLIAARLPAGTVSTHTVFCSKDSLHPSAQYCLLALLNSLVANYLVRLRVTTHVTATVMAGLYVPRPRQHSPDFAELADLARALEHTGISSDTHRYARINAIAARLYGLSPDHYAHVVGSFPLIPQEIRAKCLDYAARSVR